MTTSAEQLMYRMRLDAIASNVFAILRAGNIVAADATKAIHDVLDEMEVTAEERLHTFVLMYTPSEDDKDTSYSEILFMMTVFGMSQFTIILPPKK